MVIAVFLKFRGGISSWPGSILSVCHGENVPHTKISHEDLVVAHTCEFIEELKSLSTTFLHSQFYSE